MSTRVAVILALGTVFSAGSLQAQSVIELEDLALTPVEPTLDAAPPVQLGKGECELLSSDPTCLEASLDAAVGFSLDDVVNLGIVDRSEVREVAPEGARSGDVVASVTELPSIDLDIEFDYASAELRRDQMPPLAEVAAQLDSVDFENAILVFMGHTDAAGDASYNDELSFQRAKAAADFVSALAGIPDDRVRVSGMGFRYLKLPEAPLDAGNRRVQVLLVPA